MIKILFLIPTLGRGGAEKVLVNLVNHMDQDRFDITVMTLYDEGVNRESLCPGVKYKACFSRSFPGVAHILKALTPEQLYRHLVKDNYNVVASYLEGQTARIISGCHEPDIKKLCWIHRTYTDIKDIARLFRSEAEAKKCYQAFDQLIYVSEDVKTAFEATMDNSVTGTVCYNTNQSQLIRQMSAETVPDDLFHKDEIKLCAMGSLIPVKGFDRLIRIHCQLQMEGYPIHTYILGEGALENQLRSQIHEAEADDTITLLGYQKNPYKYMAKCDLFVCTSHSEGLSTAVTEALILGIPVCTGEVSGMLELLGENNEYGVVTANTDKAICRGIKNLLSKSEMLGYYRNQAIKRGEDFSTEATVQAAEALLLARGRKDEFD